MSVTPTFYTLPEGRAKFIRVDLLLDNAYPTGGYPIPASLFGLNNLLAVVPCGGTFAGYGASWDFVNNKLIMYRLTGHTHTENTAGAYTQNATTSNSGALPATQVVNNADLSAVTVPLLVIGY